MKLIRPLWCSVRRHCVTALAVAALCGAGAPAFAVQDAKAARYYEDALVRYEKKDIEGAIIQLKNALQIDKNMLPVQMLLGKALLQSGEVGQAEVAFQAALKLGVNRAEVVVPLGQSIVAQGKHKEFLEHAQYQPTGLPSAVRMELLLLRAVALTDVGDPRGAMKAIDEARIAEPSSPAPWWSEASLRLRQRQFREALEAVNKASALAPGAPETLYQKGAVLHVQGDLKEALALYDRSLQADPAHFEARMGRAGLYIDLARIKDAEADVAELQRQKPGEPRVSYLRALLAARVNDTAAMRAALQEITSLIDQAPIEFVRYRPQFLLLNGMAHYELDERHKAKPYLELLQRVHGSGAVSKLLAQIYLSESNVAAAIDVLESYTKLQPTDSQALALLASAHMAQGRHVRATSLMQEALKVRDAPELRTALGLSLVGGGQLGNAVKELETVYKRDPKQTHAATALVSLYMRENQPAKAAGVASALVQLQPNNASYHNLLGMAQGQAGNIAPAKAAFEQALKLDATLLAAKLNLAKLDIASKAYAAADARLREILKADEKNIDAMFDMAVLAGRQGQGAQAQNWLEKANDVAGPREVRPGLALLELHLREGRATQALEAAKKLAGKAPNNVTVLIAYSKAQLANGDATGAKTSLNNATRFADFSGPLQLEIARLQIGANNLPGAAYSLEKALSGNPGFMPANALLAEVELRQGDVAKAEKRVQELVNKYPKRADGYLLQGDIARSKGQAAASVEAYRRAHQAEPSTNTAMRLFRALATQPGNAAALQVARDWVKAHPKDTLVMKAMAEELVRGGQLAQARTTYEDVLKVTPDDAMALNNLANVHLRLKDPASAVKMAEKAQQASPNEARVIDTLGWALHLHGQPDRALQLLRDARLRDPANPEIRYHLAVVLAQSGRKTEAREELDAALKSTPRAEWLADAKQLSGTLR